MRVTAMLEASLLAAVVTIAPAAADPWKDESGNRRHERDYDDRRERGDRYGEDHVLRGHLPPPGLCKVWHEDRPAGHQPPPVNCARAERIAGRTGALVLDSSGRVQDQSYRRYDRPDRYDYPPRRGYGMEQVCAVYDSRGACLRTGYLPR